MEGFSVGIRGYFNTLKFVFLSLVSMVGKTENAGGILLHYLFPIGHKTLEIRLRNGLYLSVPRWYPFQAIAETIFLDVYHLSSFSSKDGNVVDIGASIGDFALAVRYAGIEGSVYAFEPDPRFFSMMKHNIEANHLVNVKAYNEPASLERILSIASSETGIGFMKVDCEGCEYQILIDPLFSQHVRIDEIHMETHKILDHVPTEIRNTLMASGYDVAQLIVAKCPYLHAVRRS